MAPLVLLLALLASAGPLAERSLADDSLLAAPGQHFGFNEATFVHKDGSKLDQGITPEQSAGDALAAGANSARFVVHWGRLEPTPGVLNVDYLLTLHAHVTALQKAGAGPLLLLGGTPSWARAPKDKDVAGAPPDLSNPTIRKEFTEYVDFIARLATEKDKWPSTVAIETWNEPNGRFTWAPWPDAGAYLRLHRLAAQTIRARGARALLGGIFAVSRDTTDFVQGIKYLRQLRSAGLKPSDYDGVAFHLWPVPGYEAKFLSDLEAWRSEVNSGDPNAEHWMTETGVSTTDPHGISEEQQAITLLEMLPVLFATPKMRAVYVHTLYDQVWGTGSTQYGFGLMTWDGSRPKPAFCELNALAPSEPLYPGCPTGS